ncbi:MAG: OsmC family protein [Acidobacteria bacterium]|nr:OsmC family protein [Acidobacteriota bacterium]
MPETKPPVELQLTWEGELRFSVRSAGQVIHLDSESKTGPSPMEAMGVALAGCMSVDVVHILSRGRQPLEALSASLVGRRATGEPRRFVAIDLHFLVRGKVDRAQLERALALSRQKYCSVWASMREDINLEVTYELLE